MEKVQKGAVASSLTKLPPVNQARSLDVIKGDKSLVPAFPRVKNVLWKGRLTLFTAREKMGKSTFSWFLAAQLRSGGEVFGAKVEACTVLVVSLEEALGDTKARGLALRDAVAKNIWVLADLEHESLSRIDVLRANVAAIKPHVVIIDTLAAYAAGQVADENSTSSWMAIMPDLSKLAHKTGVSLMVLHHASKSGTEARGSTVITAIPDALVEMGSVPKGDSRLRRITYKGRYASGSMVVTFDSETQRFALVETEVCETAPASNDSPGAKPLEKTVAQKVLQIVESAGDGVLYAEIRRLAKVQAQRVDGALKEMVSLGSIVKARDGRSWRYTVAA